jgi:hypothetical protein
MGGIEVSRVIHQRNRLMTVPRNSWWPEWRPGATSTPRSTAWSAPARSRRFAAISEIPTGPGRFEVAVPPVGQQDEQQVRGAVLRAMARLGLLATVTVERAGQGPAGKVENDAGP